MEKYASSKKMIAPYALVVGDIGNVQQVFLAAEERILCEVIQPQETPTALLGIFYIINTKFPASCKNVYHCLELGILGRASDKVSPIVSSIFGSLLDSD